MISACRTLCTILRRRRNLCVTSATKTSKLDCSTSSSKSTEELRNSRQKSRNSRRSLRSSSWRTPLPFQLLDVASFDLMDKVEKRGRPRIRTAQYWREYYTRKQREWRAAPPSMEKTSETKTSRRMTALLSDCRAHGHNDLTAKAEMTLTNWANRRFEFHKRSQLFIRAQRNAFRRRGVASTIQMNSPMTNRPLRPLGGAW